ncbi:protein-glutamate O-methyltransferase CheR [Spirochaetia bacterium 38H-sp]|uniref:protein-glutamate O-methyltransferase n=1 Tax=Rarispira pelagica TaxID=3141764 RepID=A0ABU9U8X4_9SPIR
MSFLSDELFKKYSDFIYNESGITFNSNNRAVLESRIKDRLRVTGLSTPEEYYNKVVSSKDETRDFLDSVTTNLTRFFRNNAHWDIFINHVVPDIIEYKKKRGERHINIWSAGCSTGEEPYTIAMLLSELLPSEFDFKIIGSDISLTVLLVAREGFYNDAKVAGIPDKYLEKYFEKVEKGYHIKGFIREKIQFDYHNLKNDSGLRNMDIVFCRNVLIYFDEAAQKATINRLWDSMGSYSYLFIGHSESLFGMNTGFEFVKTDWGSVYRKRV